MVMTILLKPLDLGIARATRIAGSPCKMSSLFLLNLVGVVTGTMTTSTHNFL